MSNKRDINLNQYGISKYKYRELQSFCMQYTEFLNERNQYYYLNSPSVDGLEKSNNISNPTANKAERTYKLSKYIDLIEQTVKETDEQLYKWILKAVTENKSWEILQPPCGRVQFYNTRRKFFYLLNLKK